MGKSEHCRKTEKAIVVKCTDGEVTVEKRADN